MIFSMLYRVYNEDTLFNIINDIYLYIGHSKRNSMEYMGLIKNIKILLENGLFYT